MAISLGFILSFALIIRLVPVIFVSQELPKTQAKLLLRGDAPPFNQWAIFFVKQGPAFLFNPRFNMCDPKIRMTVVIRNSKRMPIYPLFLYLIYYIFGINLTAAMVSAFKEP